MLALSHPCLSPGLCVCAFDASRMRIYRAYSVILNSLPVALYCLVTSAAIFGCFYRAVPIRVWRYFSHFALLCDFSKVWLYIITERISVIELY